MFSIISGPVHGRNGTGIAVVVPFEIHRLPPVPGGAVNLAYAKAQTTHREENAIHAGDLRAVQF
jgi:hypothetical protein